MRIIVRTNGLVCCLYLLATATLSAQTSKAPAGSSSRVKQSIEKSLKLLSASARVYTQEQECFSCHHQALPVMTLQLAQQRGISVSAKTIGEQAQFTRDYYQQRLEKIGQGSGIPGGSYSAGYALLTLTAAARQADSTSDAMVQYLQKKQQAVGKWRIGTHRPPLEDSDFTATAVSLAGIQWGDRQSSSHQRQQVLGRARSWLRSGQPKTTEDRVFQLLGLTWGQDSAASAAAPLLRRPYRQWPSAEDLTVAKTQSGQLLKMQQQDGGWSQLATMASDPYATGQVLCCLYVVGAVDEGHIAFRRGIEYLLQKQYEDGSWQVKTRSKPIQTYFESGFPHGKSQFISIAGSSWATMALLLSLPAER